MMERMPHRPGRKGTRTAAETELRPGEKLSALFPALTPPPHAGGGQALDGLALLIVAAEHLAWRRRSRVTARTSMFPLAPRMFIGLTDSRILVWSARYRWRIGRYLGDVSLDRVMAAEAPTAGSGWRTVVMHLADGPKVPIKVPNSIADHLASGLSGRARGGSASR